MSYLPPSKEAGISIIPLWLAASLVVSSFVLAVVFAFGFAFTTTEYQKSSLNSHSIFTIFLPKT
ncbi:MAG: hypothetical protein F6K14_16435 [Symploca sp. SIO2C1]|nr:hypothetical protein [Symploca sp. SIO2C1]